MRIAVMDMGRSGTHGGGLSKIDSTTTVLSETKLQEMFSWIDEIPLSRPKRNISRDFSDGVMVAELVHHFIPRIVELHNYSSANSVKQKLYNWNTLNDKVFKKLGMQVNKDLVKNVTTCVPHSIETILYELKGKVESYLDRKQQVEYEYNGTLSPEKAMMLQREIDANNPMPLPPVESSPNHVQQSVLQRQHPPNPSQPTQQEQLHNGNDIRYRDLQQGGGYYSSSGGQSNMRNANYEQLMYQQQLQQQQHQYDMYNQQQHLWNGNGNYDRTVYGHNNNGLNSFLPPLAQQTGQQKMHQNGGRTSSGSSRRSKRKAPSTLQQKQHHTPHPPSTQSLQQQQQQIPQQHQHQQQQQYVQINSSSDNGELVNDLRETIYIMQMKISKLEKLVVLKEKRIDDLQSKLRSNGIY